VVFCYSIYAGDLKTEGGLNPSSTHATGLRLLQQYQLFYIPFVMRNNVAFLKKKRYINNMAILEIVPWPNSAG